MDSTGCSAALFMALLGFICGGILGGKVTTDPALDALFAIGGAAVMFILTLILWGKPTPSQPRDFYPDDPNRGDGGNGRRGGGGGGGRGGGGRGPYCPSPICTPGREQNLTGSFSEYDRQHEAEVIGRSRGDWRRVSDDPTPYSVPIQDPADPRWAPHPRTEPDVPYWHHPGTLPPSVPVPDTYTPRTAPDPIRGPERYPELPDYNPEKAPAWVTEPARREEPARHAEQDPFKLPGRWRN